MLLKKRAPECFFHASIPAHLGSRTFVMLLKYALKQSSGVLSVSGAGVFVLVDWGLCGHTSVQGTGCSSADLVSPWP